MIRSTSRTRRAAFRHAAAAIAALALSALASPPLAAETGSDGAVVVTPEPGSAMRREILDAVRAEVKPALADQDLVFVVSTLRVVGDHAYLMATPRLRDGGPIDYAVTPLAELAAEGLVDDGVLALLERGPEGWRALEVAIGPTDFPALDWVETRGLPRALILD